MNIPEGISVAIAIEDADFANQKDPAFYVGGGDGSTLIAIVTDGKQQATVRCVGEMRVSVWESAAAKRRGDDSKDDQIRCYADLIDEGITTDKQLADADDRLEWENNAWFEVFTADAEGDFGDVYHEVEEAILAAIEEIKEVK